MPAKQREDCCFILFGRIINIAPAEFVPFLSLCHVFNGEADLHAIKKEGLATLFAEWDNIAGLTEDEKDKLNMKLTPEIVLKIFRSILK